MSSFVLDASYTLLWCFPDRATSDSDNKLRRLESLLDEAIVPWLWQLEVANALGKAVVREKIPLDRSLAIWNELLLLPIRQVAVGNIPHVLQLAVKHNLSVYDTCYLHLALVSRLPIATHDSKLIQAAQAEGVAVIA